MIVRSDRGVTLIGGGDLSLAALDAALARAPVVVAADGGADRALAAGLQPVAVIGDLDSLSDAARSAIPPDRLHRIAEQDSTDFQKCLSRIEAPLVIAVGFAGPRLDHLLAVLTVLARRRGPPCILLTEAEAILAAPPRLALDLPAGARVSIWPMGDLTGTSRGLRWPLDGLDLSPTGPVATSNAATGPVELSLDGPAIVLIPAAHLDAAIAGLAAGGGGGGGPLSAP